MRINEIDDTQNITELLKKHFRITGEISIIDGFVNIDGSCTLISKLSEIPIKFGKVSRHFDCSENGLTSLQGAPSSVGGGFDCSSNQLTSLQERFLRLAVVLIVLIIN